MPWSGPDDPNLPGHVKELPTAKRSQWVAVANDLIEQGKPEGEAIRTANGVVKGRTDAPMLTAERNELPDSAFLYIAPGGKKEGGKTVPRSLRKLPFKRGSPPKIDPALVRNALSRLGQAKTEIPASARESAIRRARAMLDRINARA